MGFKDPIGQLVKNNGREWHVVGVIKDFILGSPYYPTKPMVIQGSKGWFNVIHFKLNSSNTLRITLKKRKPSSKNIIRSILSGTSSLMKNMQPNSNRNNAPVHLALFCRINHFYFLSWPVWPCSLYGRRAHQRDRCKKSIGRICNKYRFTVIKRFCGPGHHFILLASPVAWWLMHNWLRTTHTV
jgi:putative ABC transport system permease protein